VAAPVRLYAADVAEAVFIQLTAHTPILADALIAMELANAPAIAAMAMYGEMKPNTRWS
jgi:hypothetical protein